MCLFRKKKKDKERDLSKAIEHTKKLEDSEKAEGSSSSTYVDKRTPAQIAFQRAQDKRVCYWIIK